MKALNSSRKGLTGVVRLPYEKYTYQGYNGENAPGYAQEQRYHVRNRTIH